LKKLKARPIIDRRALFLLGLLVVFVLSLSGCINRYNLEPWGREPVIKVLVAENLQSVNIEANGSHTLSTPNGSTPVLGNGASWLISNTAGQLSVSLNSKEHLTNPKLPIKIAPDRNTILKLNGQPYRGWLAITAGTSSGFNVINLLPLEQYLCGVVPREIGTGSKDILHAVEAQAICARSYAISRFGGHHRQGFDVYADTRDQVYSGMSRETEWCTKAVNNTRGMVVLSGNKLLDARYSSTCGGYTANSEDAWSSAIPYLRSVRDAPFLCRPYCAKSPHFNWKKAIPKKDFYSKIQRMIPSGARIKSWSLDINPKSHRVVKMYVISNKGKHTIKGSTLRSVFELKSQYYKIKQSGNKMVFEGHGWGHGVGMCQYGAMEMARRGRSAVAILRHYYRNAWVGKLYD